MVLLGFISHQKLENRTEKNVTFSFLNGKKRNILFFERKRTERSGRKRTRCPTLILFYVFFIFDTFQDQLCTVFHGKTLLTVSNFEFPNSAKSSYTFQCFCIIAKFAHYFFTWICKMDWILINNICYKDSWHCLKCLIKIILNSVKLFDQSFVGIRAKKTGKFHIWLIKHIKNYIIIVIY